MTRWGYVDGYPMKVLLAGGSGHVGTMILPYLKDHHELRILDLHPPQDDSVDYVQGAAGDPKALQTAVEGMDSFIWMTLHTGPDPVTDIQNNYEANVTGLHLFLEIATEAGIARGVYTSTLTAHDRSPDRPAAKKLGRNLFTDELSVPLDNNEVYGFTKGLGERICRYFSRHRGMSIIVLRITGPRTRAQLLAERTTGVTDGWWIEEEDLARAYLAAISSDMAGYHPIFIAGSERQMTDGEVVQEIDLTSARDLLGWVPLTSVGNPGG